MDEVRRATAEDAAALHVLAAETFPLACPPGTPRQGIDDFIAANFTEARFAGYLADPQRELFTTDGFDGYTMLVYGEPYDPDVSAAITTRPTVELSKCYTRAARHGSGVAGALVAASIVAAKARGVKAMWLGVNQFNARANRFYEKNGFVVVGEKSFFVGVPQQDFTRELIF